MGQRRLAFGFSRVIPAKTSDGSDVAGSFGLGLVEYAGGADAPSRPLATFTARCAGPLVIIQPLWGNPAGTTQLGLLGLGADGRTAAVRFGIFSKGKITALPMPVSAGGSAIDPSPLNYIAW